MIDDQHAPVTSSSATEPAATKPRSTLATEASAHALRLLEKVRQATDAQKAKRSSTTDQGDAPHAVVIGGGISGLVAARDLAQMGHRVTVLEAGQEFGGCLRRHEVAGLQVDAGAESFAVRGGTVANYLDELDLSEAIASTSGQRAWLIQGDGQKLKANPLPATALMGIPAKVRGDEVRNIIGRGAAVRAAADLITPVNKKLAAEPMSLAELVRARMGQAVLDELVAPVVNGVYSTDPAKIDVDVAAPGLRQALIDTGSLAKAVDRLQSSAPAGSRVAGLDGGMYTLITALTEHLRQRKVALVRNSAATKITRDEKAERPYTVHTLGQQLPADRVVLATEAETALRLLNPLLEAEDQIEASTSSNDIALAILVVDKPELDDAPRGSGVLVARGADVTAKALTHSTAKWPWLAAEAGPGTHVVRLSYGRIGEQEPLVASRDDAALIAQAVKDASKILGVELQDKDILGSSVSRFTDMVPLQGGAAAERRTQVNRAVESLPGLDVVGAWLAGTGLARVIAHTRQAVAISAR